MRSGNGLRSDSTGNKYKLLTSSVVQAHMAAALRYWGKMGFGEGIAGHITVRDPVFPDHYWYQLCFHLGQNHTDIR